MANKGNEIKIKDRTALETDDEGVIDIVNKWLKSPLKTKFGLSISQTEEQKNIVTFLQYINKK